MFTYSVVLLVPVTGKYSKISSRWVERDRNDGAATNFDAAISSSGLVEVEGGEVKEAAYLVLHLKYVREVLTWWDRAVCAIYSILPRVSSLLYSVPAYK